MKVVKLLFLPAIVGLFLVLSMGCASRTVYVQKAPPVVKVEKPGPKPYTNAMWVSGHWTWKNGRYVWVSGHWTKTVKGKTWVAGRWKKTARGYVWVKGYWRR